MTQKVHQLLKDSPVARWTALILLALMMFFAYMFVDVLSPLKSMLETQYGWTSSNYGVFTGSEYFLNVFAFFLIFAGIILDKMGIRFTAILSAVVMVVGASIKYFAVSEGFVGSGIEHAFQTEPVIIDNWPRLQNLLNNFFFTLPSSTKLASLGFMIFGCGVEMAGITVSKAIVKWFKGKELALAMGIEMAIARLGVFAVFRISPRIAEKFSSVSAPVLFCLILLLIGAISFIVYCIMDKKLDKQMGESGLEPDDPFKIRDIGKLFTSKTFLLVAGLCVLYYSAIFPFQKFAANMLESRLHISSTEASDIFSWFPIGAMILTPLLGAFLDNKGKGATMLIIGAVLMCFCHLIFALVPAAYFTKFIAYTAIIVLGVSFSLVPAALWPSVPKLVENRYLGSAYSVIFWIQNIGLLAFPMIIGASLDNSNPGMSERIKDIRDNMESINMERQKLDSVYYLADNQLSRFNNEFVTADFSLTHKNEAMISKYVGDVTVSMDNKMQRLDLYYYNAGTRDSLIGSMREDVAKIKAFHRDSLLRTYTDQNLAGYSINTVADSLDYKLAQLEEVQGDAVYNYRTPMLIFASLGILAFILGIWLKIEDRRKKYGLELPNIQKDK